MVLPFPASKPRKNAQVTPCVPHLRRADGAVVSILLTPENPDRFVKGLPLNCQGPIRGTSPPKPYQDPRKDDPWEKPYIPNFDPKRMAPGPERDFMVMLSESGLTLRAVTELWNILYGCALDCTAASYKRRHPEITQGVAVWKQLGEDTTAWFMLTFEWIVQQNRDQDGRTMREVFEQAVTALPVPEREVG
jgi:hypothetical protein